MAVDMCGMIGVERWTIGAINRVGLDTTINSGRVHTTQENFSNYLGGLQNLVVVRCQRRH